MGTIPIYTVDSSSVFLFLTCGSKRKRCVYMGRWDEKGNGGRGGSTMKGIDTPPSLDVNRVP